MNPSASKSDSETSGRDLPPVSRWPLGVATLAFSLLLVVPVIRSANDVKYGHDLLLLWDALCRYLDFSSRACSGTWIFQDQLLPRVETANFSFRVYPASLLFVLSPLAYLSPLKAYLALSVITITSASAALYMLFDTFFDGRQKSDLYAPLATSMAVVLSFPFYYAILIGQQSPLLLLFLSGYLVAVFLRCDNRICGLLLALLSMKPQSMVLLYLFLFFHVRSRAVRVQLISLMLGGIVLYGIAFMVQPDAFPRVSSAQFHQAVSALQPNIGSWLEFVTGVRILRLLPLFVAVAWCVIFGAPQCSARTIALRIVPLSLLVTPYCGAYDCVLLTPALVILSSDAFLTLGRQRALLFLSIPMLLMCYTRFALLYEQYYLCLPLWFLSMSFFWEKESAGKSEGKKARLQSCHT